MTDVSPPDEPPVWQPEAHRPLPVGAPFGHGSGPADSQGRLLAEWWQRAVAIIIDVILLAIAYRLLSAVFATSTGVVTTSHGTSVVHTGHLVISELTELALTLVYFGILDGSSNGQTVGKLVMGIATRDVTTGGPIGPARAALRRFVYLILFFLLFLPGLINVLSPLWDKRRQAWHDKIGSSDVVKVR